MESFVIVGMAGFEPTTSSTPCWRDTGLRYIPYFEGKYNKKTEFCKSVKKISAFISSINRNLLRKVLLEDFRNKISNLVDYVSFCDNFP